MLLQNRTRAEIKEHKKRQLLLIPPKKNYIYVKLTTTKAGGK